MAYYYYYRKKSKYSIAEVNPEIDDLQSRNPEIEKMHGNMTALDLERCIHKGRE